MRATFQAKAAIYKLLTDSQDPVNGLPFVIDPSIEINAYQPSAFSIEGHADRVGVYLYFDRTVFKPDNGGKQSQSHYPMFNIDVCVSASATRNNSTGEVASSMPGAQRGMEDATTQIYEAISHASFRRLVEETIPEAEYTPSIVVIEQAEALDVLRLPDSTTSIVGFRFVCSVGVCEIHGTATGVPLDVIDDQLLPETRKPEQ